ncbi:MAG: GTP-binding protein [Elainellaceae cyanobacterium]
MSPSPQPQQNFDHDPDSTLADDLDAAIASLDQMQGEISYRSAQATLNHLLDHLDLTPEEADGLQADIDHLHHMLHRLDQGVVQIAVFGLVGRGKSSVLNALLGRDLFQTGPLHGVTQTIERTPWTVAQDMAAARDGVQGGPDALPAPVRLSVGGQGQSRLELIDTPGLDEISGEERDAIAYRLAQQVDLILFVVAGDISQLEYEALCRLREASKPMLVVFNKVDQYPAVDRYTLYQTLRDRRLRELISPHEIVMVAAAPLMSEATRSADGTIDVQRFRGAPRIEALKLKILDVLQHDGKALVALNTMLYADEVNEKLVQRKLVIRDRAADRLIWRAVMTKAVAVAANPITVADLISGTVVDGVMIFTLSRLYGIAMTERGAARLLRQIAVSLGGLMAGDVAVTVGLGSLKSALGLSIPMTGGWAAAPYISVAIAQAGIAGTMTYAIGQAAKTYLSNGASWGPCGPKAAAQEIIQSLDEASILSRIKHELRSRLRTSIRLGRR